MYSDQFKQGPLAQVWMAANYEKKLTKQQFLSTNLVRSSEMLNQPFDNNGHITLRLSGQLLLGIVKIYSRKTKYLLDDVNDILFKLKNSFKYASGGVLLGSEHHSTTNVAERNTVTNINSLLLTDQITAHDLLYQEDFSFDEDNQPFSNLNQQPDDTVDMSIEYGRLAIEGDDDNIDFDLDLNDDSIEIGRDASIVPQEQSFMDIGGGKDIPEFDLGFEPLETVDDTMNEPITPTNEPIEPIQRKKIVGITENGTVKTTKRKLQIDDVSQVNTGITIEELHHLRDLQLSDNWRDNHVKFKLSDNDKLQLIKDLAQPIGFKKRKIWDINQELTDICNNLSMVEQQQDFEPLEEPFEDFRSDDQPSFDNFDFDISLPEFEHQELQSEPDFEFQSTVADATKRVANIIKENDVNSFKQLIDNDIKQESPLGLNKRNNGDSLNMKKEASRCFFEMLVLATRDCIKIDQDSGTTETDIGGDIHITKNQKIFSF